jgi:hypothetical protein
MKFPADSGVIDVTKPLYNAKGDGKTDDTEAIQKALSQYSSGNRIIYLPGGIYLVSDTLKWPKANTVEQITNWHIDRPVSNGSSD